jgi:hypothetical protein
MASKNQQYINLIGGQSLNVLDVLNNQSDKTLERLNIVVDTSNGLPTDILLPEIAQLNGFTNFEITVADNTGGAAAANITITKSGTNNINGLNNKVINANNGKVLLQIGLSSSWSAFDTYSSAAYVPPTQINETLSANGASELQTSNFPILASQHLIVVHPTGAVLNITTQYSVNYATGVITVPSLGPGDLANVFYSY